MFRFLTLCLSLTVLAACGDVSSVDVTAPAPVPTKLGPGDVCPGACDDGDPCTLDSCGSHPPYQCIHELLAECATCHGPEQACDPNGINTCVSECTQGWCGSDHVCHYGPAEQLEGVHCHGVDLLSLEAYQGECSDHCSCDRAPCREYEVFLDSARIPLSQTCEQCHTTGSGRKAMNIAFITENPQPDNCQEVKDWVNFGNPSNSRLFYVVDPLAGDPHPWHFPTVAGWLEFREQVSIWIAAEE